jgi:dihydropyrimidine dehydrogenase (NAD+) subunit PreT
MPGGLSTYGIIALREPVEVALEETRMIEGWACRSRPGSNSARMFRSPIFRGVRRRGAERWPGQHARLGIEGEEAIVDGLEFIEASKTDPASMSVGRNVIVIGAGNTAVDCATIARRLGASG